MYTPTQNKKFKKKKDSKGLFWGHNLGDRAEEASVFFISVGYYLSVKPIKILVG